MEPFAKPGWEKQTNMAPRCSIRALKAAHQGCRVEARGDRLIKTGTERFMQNVSSTNLTRRAILGAFAATAISAAPFFPGVTAYARGSGDIRKLHFYSGRTGESMNVIYWIDGKYIPESLAEINHFFRDWRNNAVHNIDTRTVDFLAAAHNILRVNEPYMLLSGYRSPQTNAMLRARSRNVAQNSLHLRGQAADVRLRSRTVRQISQAAQACNAGGVGRYSRSDFVHFDCGAVRSWGS
jgi:uncharacterized protein YcbK (DUF882 family)